VTNALGVFRKILPDADELPKRTETDFSRRYSLQTFSPQPMIFSAGCGLSPSGFAERRQTMLDDTTKWYRFFRPSTLFFRFLRYSGSAADTLSGQNANELAFASGSSAFG